jgi:hypothetical protein
MKNIKKFNEHSFKDYIEDGELPADYTPKTGRSARPVQDVPITMEYVKDSIIEVMKDYNEEIDITDTKVAEAINSLAEKIMGDFQDKLAYISDNYEDDIENILSLGDNY